MPNQTSQEHDDIFPLLPWYANRTLEAEKRAAVTQHLSSCEECQHEIQWLSLLNESAQNDNDAQYNKHADLEKNLSSVMDRIDSTSRASHSGSDWLTSVKHSIDKVFSSFTSLSVPQIAMTAMAGVLVAVVGVQVYTKQTQNNYSVLSSSETQESSLRLSIELTGESESDVLPSTLQQIVEKLGQPFNIHKGTDGRYTLAVSGGTDVDKLNALINELEGTGQIQRVEILP